MATIISIENLSKIYQLGSLHKPYLTFRDNILSLFSQKNSKKDFFYALKNISFSIDQGESIGIVGKNGAGKSTLLKILSRITPLTSGRVVIRGRVASLLEVGTGFHGELSGRENVYFNGSILGMKKKEIDRKFDEIVDFSGVERFIDTPLKHYSSGMQVRLAFAVASNLEPEIMMVDEVLAVGDMVFQRKCIDKMINISNEGRTILFVSHNISALKALCKTAILLKDGEMKVEKNNINMVLNAYTNDSEINKIQSSTFYFDSVIRKKSDTLNLKSVHIGNYPVKFGEKIILTIELISILKQRYDNLDLAITISDKYQNCIIHVGNRFINKHFNHKDDNIKYVFEIENNLRPGFYLLTFFLRSNEAIHDWLINVIEFEINDGNPYGYIDTSQLQGIVLPEFSMSTTSH